MQSVVRVFRPNQLINKYIHLECLYCQGCPFSNIPIRWRECKQYIPNCYPTRLYYDNRRHKNLTYK